MADFPVGQHMGPKIYGRWKFMEGDLYSRLRLRFYRNINTFARKVSPSNHISLLYRH